jgi:hypothetical protein
MSFQQQPSSRLNRRRNTRSLTPHPRPNLLEPLETRRLLTTLVGGGYDNNGQPLSTVYDFKDSKEEIIRIIVGGDTRAEFVGAVFDEETGAMTLGDLTPAPVGDDDPNAELPGSDLFAIYVEESDAGSFIAVSGLDEDANPPEVTPYEGNVTLTVRDLQDNGNWTSMSTDDGTGVAFLGARSPAIDDVDDSEDRPILSGRLTDPIGILPLGSGRTLRAGLTIAGGNDFGRFLFGGTISGRVRATGSVDEFYAGNILTGDTRGGALQVNDNFRVDGDLRDLVVLGSVGTMEEGEGNPLDRPRYLTGFDLLVVGQLGQFNARGNIYGGGRINASNRNEIRTPQVEVESRGALEWVGGYVDTDQFFNDTFDTPQYIGTIDDDDIRVRGTLHAIDDDDFDDFVDYYAVPLLAGQTVSARVEGLALLMNLGIFDPDGRLIATDYSDVDPTAITGSDVRFTADRPGVYRFAVATAGDGDFDGTGGDFEATEIGVAPYDLRIINAGELGVGGIVAGGNIFNHTTDVGFELRDDDFGAIVAGETLLSSATRTVSVFDGNLRAVQGDAVGLRNGNVLGLGADLHVPRGHVGLARSTGGILVINSLLATVPIGGNVQILDSAGTFYGNILAKGSLGVLRAGDLATRSPSSITVNSDERGRDGIIDLIDVQGDLGTIQGGGPWITTGPSGNVRYFNVEGDVFRDVQFGGGEPQDTQFGPGEEVRLNDDSGARVEITPSGNDSLEVLTYGIRGSGGVAVLRVISTGGLNIDSDGRARNAGVEFGKIVSSAPATETAYLQASGSVPVDVLNLHGLNFGEVVNGTEGEIVSVLARSIERLEAENVGVPRARVAPAVQQGAITVANLHPFNQLRGGILAGDIQHLEADDALGNVAVSPTLAAAAFAASRFNQLTGLTPDFNGTTGSIGAIFADADRSRAKNSFEGITAPIYASGDVGEVNPGAGIADSGSGDGSRAGLYAEGSIGSVRGARGTEIRGNVVSNTSIDSIRLVGGGSIINANIMVGDLEDAREFAFPRTLTSDNDPITDPTYEIGEIAITNTGSAKSRPPGGGIIGTYVQAPDLGRVNVTGGFGILNSVFAAPGNGVMQGIRADGYGIRDVYINAGANLGELVAVGNGKHAPINSFSAAVRQSERRNVDPFFNAAPSRLTDLHRFFDSNGRNTINNVTNRGMIAGADVRASRDLGLLQAWQVRGSTSNTAIFPNTFNFANSIREIDVRRDVLNATIVTGALTEMNVGRHANRLDMTVAGTAGTIDIGGTFGSTSRILASGPDGTINLISVGGDLNGIVRATRRIGRLVVGGELNGEVTAGGQPVQPS